MRQQVIMVLWIIALLEILVLLLALINGPHVGYRLSFAGHLWLGALMLVVPALTLVAWIGVSKLLKWVDGREEKQEK